MNNNRNLRLDIKRIARDDKNWNLRIRLEHVDTVPRCAIIHLDGADLLDKEGFIRVINRVLKAGYIRLIFNMTSFRLILDTDMDPFLLFWARTLGKGGRSVVVLPHLPKYGYESQLQVLISIDIAKTVEDAIKFINSHCTCPKCFQQISDRRLRNFRQREVRKKTLRCPRCKQVIEFKESLMFFAAFEDEFRMRPAIPTALNHFLEQ